MRRSHERGGTGRPTVTTTTVASEVVSALHLPSSLSPSAAGAVPLPMAELHSLPRDASMIYAIGSVDASGRVSDRGIVTGLGWHPGDKLELTVVDRSVVMRASSSGDLAVSTKGRILIPLTARRQCGVEVGDDVLVAAAPEFGIAIIYPLSAVDDMISRYHDSDSPPRASRDE
jgi:bifunctional DNA-binding transcriptional regulator/antitoxin component of YhaV-PrlF toxin-antitoxin module